MDPGSACSSPSPRTPRWRKRTRPRSASAPTLTDWFTGGPDAEDTGAAHLDELIRQSSYVPFNALQNVTGQPAVNVPLHWTADSLPIGVTLSGRMGEEALLISLSAQLEAAKPWTHRRPLMG
jgi:Asp-tRNA(Asn)/Glu-tRNA(Gln) amidotransferase A subunit family amidase